MLIIFTLILLLFPHNVFAVDEFKVTNKINYYVELNGSATVKQEISLTNNISQIYAKEYQINLSNTNYQNIKGNDKFGDIIESVTTDKETTTVKVKFSNPTIGKDQTNQFFISYSIPEFAKKKGNTWEIQFPVFDTKTDQSEINTILSIPNTFGELSFSSIPIGNTHLIDNRTQIQFNQTLSKNKVLLIFGNHQLFDIKLNYSLQNKDNKDIVTKIPLPPDTNNQTVFYKEINPLPSNIVSDKDGNWLAEYILKPGQEISVSVIGQVKVHPPTTIERSLEISGLTEPQVYWPTTDPQIVSISQNLQSPQQIYNYVVDTLNYNYEQINYAQRKGATYAINNPNNALCTEFTDLFVTLARAANIPAREIEGFAYSNNSKIKPTNTGSDILHAWPEYFDTLKNTWIQVDPTWEKTTNGIDYFSDLDLNHITFVIHGLDSINPPPPGSYKKDNSEKSVFVDFANDSLPHNFTPPAITVVGSNIVIKNPNLYTIPTFSLTLSNIGWSTEVPSMIPYSTINIELKPIPFWQQALPNNQKYKFVITQANDLPPIITNITNPNHYLYLSITAGILIVLLCLGGIILTANHKHEKNS